MNGLNKRLSALEMNSTQAQRKTLHGLIALCEAGTLQMKDLTDEELERLIAGHPGDSDVRHLSDAELEAIIRGE